MFFQLLRSANCAFRRRCLPPAAGQRGCLSARALRFLERRAIDRRAERVTFLRAALDVEPGAAAVTSHADGAASHSCRSRHGLDGAGPLAVIEGEHELVRRLGRSAAPDLQVDAPLRHVWTDALAEPWIHHHEIGARVGGRRLFVDVAIRIDPSRRRLPAQRDRHVGHRDVRARRSASDRRAARWLLRERDAGCADREREGEYGQRA